MELKICMINFWKRTKELKNNKKITNENYLKVIFNKNNF
jgi:hypothetical protein